MARKKTTTASQRVQPEDDSQDVAATQGGGQEGHGFAPGSSRKMSKGHFSATKSKLKSAEAVDAKESAPKAAPKSATRRQQEPVEDYQTPPEQPAGRDGNLLDALEQMKPLIAQYGPDHVKRMVDLLG